MRREKVYSEQDSFRAEQTQQRGHQKSPDEEEGVSKRRAAWVGDEERCEDDPWGRKRVGWRRGNQLTPDLAASVRGVR